LTFNLAERLDHKFLQASFDKFKVNGLKRVFKEKVIRQVFNKQLTRYYRSVFDTWKTEASFREVVRMQNEEGPLALEICEIQNEIKNLKIMLKDKMIMNEQECRDAIEKDDERYEHLINKARLRMNIFGEGQDGKNDKWLLVYCLNTWKKWQHTRKNYGQALNMLKYHGADDGMNGLGHAFKHWEHIVKDNLKRLNGMKQEDLFSLHHKQ